MTHDELLAEIDSAELGWYYGWMKDSLRAVVELTQTYKDNSYVNEEFNQGLQTAFRLVIQAIEKELE